MIMGLHNGYRAGRMGIYKLYTYCLRESVFANVIRGKFDDSIVEITLKRITVIIN